MASPYDESLLAEAPAATKKQLQHGYNPDLLVEKPVVHTPPASNSRQNSRLDLEAYGRDGRSTSAVALPPPIKSKPFYRTRKGIIAIAVVIIIIIVAAAVGGAVGGSKGKSSSPQSTDSGSSNSTSSATAGGVGVAGGGEQGGGSSTAPTNTSSKSTVTTTGTSTPASPNPPNTTEAPQPGQAEGANGLSHFATIALPL